MQLSDLFVSHKQVEPIVFIENNSSLPQPIYLNLDRVKKITAPEAPEFREDSKPSEEYLDWKVVNADVVGNPQDPIQYVSYPKSWLNPYKGNKNKWISDITAAYKRIGLNDNAIKNLVTKNALESGYGTYAQGDFNFGNITAGKSWKGRFVNGRDSNANGQPIKQKFRAYASLDDYVKDEIQFLTSLYDFNQDDDFQTFSSKLQGANKGGRKYAEASSYVKTLQSVYNSIYGKGRS